MNRLFNIVLVEIAAVVCLAASSPSYAEKGVSSTTDRTESVQSRVAAEADLNIPKPEHLTAVIYPFQSATVGSEVRGVLGPINFKEGQPVEKGAVVAEVSKERYESIVGEFKGNYEAIIRTLHRAREELALQEELYEKRAATFDDVSKARSQVRVLEARLQEAEFKLKQAELNLKACVVTAPFSGLIGVLYHQPYESVDNLEKIFEIVDTSKVYARVNWPEARLGEIRVGKKAKFLYGGKSFEGVVDKISPLIDPASKSKRVHILIENGGKELHVGMSGSVSLADSTKVSLDMDK